MKFQKICPLTASRLTAFTTHGIATMQQQSMALIYAHHRDETPLFRPTNLPHPTIHAAMPFVIAKNLDERRGKSSLTIMSVLWSKPLCTASKHPLVNACSLVPSRARKPKPSSKP